MIESIFQDTRESMEKSIDSLKNDLTKIRTGRASLSILDNIRVDYYGTTTPLKQMASLSVPESRLITIQPWDVSIIGEIRQGVWAANVGLTPVIDNNLIRISVPALTTERRGEYVKLLHQKAEETRITVRNIRQDKMRVIKTAFEEKHISEDEKFHSEEELQKITDEFIAIIEELGEKKEQEIMTV